MSGSEASSLTDQTDSRINSKEGRGRLKESTGVSSRSAWSRATSDEIALLRSECQ